MGRKTGAFFYGLVTAVIISIIPTFLLGFVYSPMVYVGVIVFFTPFVMWCRLMELKRKDREKAKEEERQAEQDRTNELMREYLEKKLHEDSKE